MRLTEARLRRIIREELIRENLENEIEAKFGTAEDNVKPSTGADFKAAARSPQVKRLVDDLLQDPDVVAALQAALGGAGQVTEARGETVTDRFSPSRSSRRPLHYAAEEEEWARWDQQHAIKRAAQSALAGGGLAALMASPGMIPVVQAIVNASGAPSVGLLAGLGLAGGAGVALLTALAARAWLKRARMAGERASGAAATDAYYQSTYVNPKEAGELLARAIKALKFGGSHSLGYYEAVLLPWVLAHAPIRPALIDGSIRRSDTASEKAIKALAQRRLKFEKQLQEKASRNEWHAVSSLRARGKSYLQIAKKIKSYAPEVRKIIEEFDLEKALGRPGLIDALGDYNPSTEAAKFQGKVGRGQWTPETAGYYDDFNSADNPDWYEEDRAAYNTTSTRRGVRRRQV